MSYLTAEEKKKVKKPFLWIGIASMFMAFAGLTSGYVVSRKALLQSNLWMEFALPNWFLYSTVVIGLSSVTMVLASRMINRDDTPNATRMIGITFGLGLLFLVFQYAGWQDLIDRGIYFTGKGSSTSGSWVYAITFFHLLHILAGLISLAKTANSCSRGKYSRQKKLGFELAAIFWHFLGALWLYLFLFLLFIR
ncbi:MAG: Cytochrome c oxidase subunit 3 [Flavobacteriia bacterium]|jgi:cytochrome c oxidase subunit 3|nr:MAG: Cytochrome c oxidase subunit 3 [Flavobacteriia bacterium]